MNETALKQYGITTTVVGPTLPGQITSGFFDDIGDVAGGVSNPIRIRYYNVGKLYFGFWSGPTNAGPGGFVYNPIGNNAVSPVEMTDAVNRIATVLGITVNTIYKGNIYNSAGSPRTSFYNTGTLKWQQSNGNEAEFLLAILAN